MTEMISSRTPEGDPSRCPVCDHFVQVEPSLPSGDAPCPNCGTLLWFIRHEEEIRFYEAEKVSPVREQLIRQVAEILSVDPEEVIESMALVEDLGADSLDTVELVMELEEKFDTEISEEDAKRLHTVAQVIEWLVKHRRS